MASDRDTGGSSLSFTLFIIIFAVIVVMLFINKQHHNVPVSANSIAPPSVSSPPVTHHRRADSGLTPLLPTIPEKQDTASRRQEHVNIYRQDTDRKLSHKHNKKPQPMQPQVTVNHGRNEVAHTSKASQQFWSTLANMQKKLIEYCRQVLNKHFSHVASKHSIDIFTKMNISTFLNGTDGTTIADIRDLYNLPKAEKKEADCNIDELYRNIFLYILYDKEEKTFNELIQDVLLLSKLPNNMAKDWVAVMQKNCENTADRTAAKIRVNHFMNFAYTQICLKLANGTYTNAYHRLAGTPRPKKAFTNKRFACLLRTFLLYWQFQAVAEKHRKCCKNTLKRYDEPVAKVMFLLVQDKLTNDELLPAYPHLWFVLADIINRHPAVVFSIASADSAALLLEAMSANLAALEQSLKQGALDHAGNQKTTGSPAYSGKDISDIFFGHSITQWQEAQTKLNQALANISQVTATEELATYTMPNNAVVSFIRKHPITVGLSNDFFKKLHTIVTDNVVYYKFLARMGSQGNNADILYTLNVLDKPLAVLRSRMGESHGLLIVAADDKRLPMLATDRCTVRYIPAHNAIISRQYFTRLIDVHTTLTYQREAHFRVVSSVRPLVHVDAVSALVCDEYPVIHNTLIMSLVNSYEPHVDVLDENKYLFIRANNLKVFGASFPPSIEVLDSDTRFIDKLHQVSKLGNEALACWSRWYAMGELLLIRACRFIGERWNKLASKDARFTPIRDEKSTLILLWQFFKLRAINALYKEYKLIFGSLSHCDDAGLLQQSHEHSQDLLVIGRLILVRLTCINYLLNQWSQAGDAYSHGMTGNVPTDLLKKKMMESFVQRHQGIDEMFRSRDSRMLQSFHLCFANDNDNLRLFSSQECYTLFDKMLISTDNDTVMLNVVPLYGYSSLFPMHSIIVKLDDGSQAQVYIYNGNMKFTIPIRNARATCQVIDGKTNASLLHVDVLSTEALFVSLVIRPINANSQSDDDENLETYLEYLIEVQIGHRSMPIDAESKQTIVSFSARPTSSNKHTHIYNSHFTLLANRHHLKATLAANRAKRTRMSFSASPNLSYYEVPSLDELELSASSFVKSVLSSPTESSLPLTGADGVYFSLNDERYTLSV